MTKPQAPTVTLDISKLVLPCYYPLHQPNFEDEYSRVYLRGGRYSGKSVEATRYIVLHLVMDPEHRASAIAFRRYSNTLQGSVFNEFLNAISDLSLGHLFKINYNPLCITYLPYPNQKIIFQMLNQPDDYQKVKSIKLVNSYFRYIWFEEADEFTDPSAIRQVLLSLFRNGTSFLTFFTFNTPFSNAHPLNAEWLHQPVTASSPSTPSTSSSDGLPETKKYYYQHTTIYDLPPTIISPDIWSEVEDMRINRPKEYAHTILGKAGDMQAQVFPNIFTVSYPTAAATAGSPTSALFTSPESPVYRADNILRGLDFGFAPDPTAYIDVYYDRTKRDLYILSEMYDYRLSSRNIANQVQQKWSLFGPITCDVDLRVIDELNSLGLVCWPARKGPNSVELGIKWLQELNHIYIDPNRTPNAYREFTTYEYQRDKFGNLTTKLPDKDNHTIDACRYAVEEYWSTVRLVKANEGKLF